MQPDFSSALLCAAHALLLRLLVESCAFVPHCGAVLVMNLENKPSRAARVIGFPPFMFADFFFFFFVSFFHSFFFNILLL